MRIPKIKIEVEGSHPDTGVYDADSNIAADQINLVNRTLTRDTVLGSEILNATDTDEFTALTAGDKGRWLALCGVDEVNTSSGVAKSLEAELFGPGSATRTNLMVLRDSQVSRAEEIGVGFVWPGEITQARAYHG